MVAKRNKNASGLDNGGLPFGCAQCAVAVRRRGAQTQCAVPVRMRSSLGAALGELLGMDRAGPDSHEQHASGCKLSF